MSTPTAKTLLTAEDYLRLPDIGPSELVRGEIIEMSPPPSHWHGVVCSNVNLVLATWARANQAGDVACNDAGVVTERNPDSVRGADCQFTSRARLPEDARRQGYAPVPPDLVVEVVSDGDRWSKVIRKVDEYLDAGVLEVWVVEPQREFVEVHRPNQRPIRFEKDDELSSEPLLPGFRCRVADFFV